MTCIVVPQRPSARRLAAGFALFGLAACSNSGDRNQTGGRPSDSAGAAAFVVDSTARATSIARTIAAGTAIEATIQEPISSRTDREGQQVNAIVSRNVLDAGGAVAIPGGAPIVLAVTMLRAANGANGADGSIALTMTSVLVRDTSYAPTARVSTVARTLAPGTPITITLTQPFKMAAK